MLSEKEILQMLTYNFISTDTDLNSVINDIDLSSIANKNIDEANIKQLGNDILLAFDLEDIESIQSDFIDLELVINLFVEEGHNLSNFIITERPISNSFVIMSVEHDVGIDIIIENNVPTPYYINNTSFPNLLKANSIIDAFNKNNR